MVNLFNKIKDYILPLLTAFFLNASIFGLYGENIFSVYNFASLIIIIAMFLYFGFMNKHRIIGGLIYFVLIVISLFLCMHFVFSDSWGSGFQTWFLSAGDERNGIPAYFWALVCVFPFFLSSVVYYFTVILYRPSFLLLGSLVPCAIYVKTLSNISTFYLVSIAFLNLLIYTLNAEKLSKDTDSIIKSGKNARFISGLFITSLTLVIASLIPKQGEAKYYETFEKYFMNAGSGESTISRELSEHSGDAGEYRDLDSTVLYNIYADNLLYFRKQNFDVYSKDEHCWYPLDEFSSDYSDNVSESLGEREYVNLDDMLEAMKKGAELSDELKSITPEKILALDSVGESAAIGTIVPSGFDPEYKISSARTFHVSNADNLLINSHKELLSGSRRLSGTSYTFSYYTEQANEDLWTENGGSDFLTDEDYQNYLDMLKSVLSENNETSLLKTVESFENEFLYSLDYKNAYEYNLSEIPEDIQNLAAELTSGLTYDYEKATALETYFQDNFTYDLNYYPPDGMNTASYFIFESKRGTCSDFATAFTLLARSAGLTVRYTEGFSPDITAETGVYVIRASSSHAYPEVYIKNLGWTVYEPTVSGAYSISGGVTAVNGNNNISIDTNILFTVIASVCALFAIIAAVYFLIPAVKHLAEENTIKKGGEKSLRLIYKRIGTFIVKKDKTYKKEIKSFTPTETCDTFTKLYDYDLSEFLAIYHNTIYGEIALDEKANITLSKIYHDILKARKEHKHK